MEIVFSIFPFRIVGEVQILYSIEELNAYDYSLSNTVIVVIDPQREHHINLRNISNVDSLVISGVSNADHITLSPCHNLKEITMSNLLALESIMLFDVDGNVDVRLGGNYMIKDYDL